MCGLLYFRSVVPAPAVNKRRRKKLDEEFRMIANRVCLVVLGAAVALVPAVSKAQVDPNTNPTGVGMPNQGQYPQSPQNINQPSGLPGSTSPNGAQGVPMASMRDSLGNPGQTGQHMLDQRFVRTAAQNGIADVKIGMLAVQKGGAEVKDLGQKMVDDHTAINKDMVEMADLMGTTLPKKMSKEDEAEYEKLNGLSGKEFDAEYLTYISKSHFQDLHTFHQEASVASEPELTAEVVKAMHTMHEHLGLIAKTAAAEGITLPPRPQRPAPPAAK
jgi:putative membrane protein